jgi:NAD(P)-dependent dehydrogenase (short-subunit alcohol dehydrogenase family)
VRDTAAALASRGIRSTGETVDMTNAAEYQRWVGRASENLGGCDIFIPFASAGGGGPSEENWRKSFDLDLMATYRGVEAALPFLRRSKAGSIVAIGTVAAVEDFFGPQPYNAIKAAVINYASALSQQLAPDGVRVNTVSPGPTFATDGAWDQIKTAMPAVYEATLAKMPIGRLCTASEVANAIAFVASPACRGMTGAHLVVDGGYTRRVQF